MRVTASGTVERADVSDLFAEAQRRAPGLTYKQYLSQQDMSGLRVEFDEPLHIGIHTRIAAKIPMTALPREELLPGHRVAVDIDAGDGRLTFLSVALDTSSTPQRYPTADSIEQPVDIDQVAVGEVVRFFVHDDKPQFDAGYAVKAVNSIGEIHFIPLTFGDVTDQWRENIHPDYLRSIAERGELLLVTDNEAGRALRNAADLRSDAPARPPGRLRAFASAVARRLQS